MQIPTKCESFSHEAVSAPPFYTSKICDGSREAWAACDEVSTGGPSGDLTRPFSYITVS